MSDRIVEGLNEMKQIYLNSVSGQVISKRDEYLQYIEEKKATKDYDGDGEIESGEEEHAGSVHNAIQRNLGGIPDGNPPKRRKNNKISEQVINVIEEVQYELQQEGYEIEDIEEAIKYALVESEEENNRLSVTKRAKSFLKKNLKRLGKSLKYAAAGGDPISSTPKDDPRRKQFEWGQKVAKRLNRMGTRRMLRRVETNMAESFSDWRGDLYEKIGDVESDIKKTKENKIIERSNIDNKIEINPNVNIGEQVELSEEYIEEVVDIASQYFYEQGLNEEGLEMVIEELGYDKFIEYVFYISEDFILTEARRAKRVPTTPEEREAKIAKIKREIDSREAAKKKPTTAKKVVTSKGNDTVKTAVQTQSKKPQQKSEPKGFERAAGQVRDFVTSQETKDKLKDMVGAAVRKAKSDIGKTGMAAIHATGAAKKARQRGASGAGAAGAAAGTFIRGLMRGSTATGVKEEIEAFLLEKSESQQQQKLFGLALSVVRGETPRSEVSKEVLDIVDGMSEKEIRKFAKTPHKGLPKKVED